jgi:hypothetical protein
MFYPLKGFNRCKISNFPPQSPTFLHKFLLIRKKNFREPISVHLFLHKIKDLCNAPNVVYMVSFWPDGKEKRALLHILSKKSALFRRIIVFLQFNWKADKLNGNYSQENHRHREDSSQQDG